MPFFFRPRHLSVSSFFFAASAAMTAAIAAETVSMPQSDEADAGSWAKRDEYVVVTATREPESVANILVPIAVIDRDDIDRSLAIDVAQLLGQQAGIDITPYGGPGQTVSVFMRGTNSNHTVFLVDGIRIDPGTIGVAALQNVAPDLVDHVEIVKGPRSAIYGTDAIGGIVNIITRTPQSTGATDRKSTRLNSSH